jgi:hypothetical protein
MKKHLLLPLGLTFAFGCTNGDISTDNAPSVKTSELRATESPAVHGMVVFGKDTLFVSHIPMFMTPHDRQALMQVRLSHAQSNALAVYQKAALSSTGAQALITIRPKPFLLTNLLNGKLTSFQADLYKGNFEAGGRVLLSNVTVSVEDILYSTQLSKISTAARQLTYIPVETEGESYLVHQITAPQNFDHIVQIQWLNGNSSSTKTLAGFPWADKEASRLKSGQFFVVDGDGAISETDSMTEASFQVVAAFYCTQGPDFYNVCD